MSARDYERFMGEWSRLAAAEVLKSSPPPSGVVVLDVACGTGAFSASLLASADVASLACADLSSPFVAHARMRFSHDRRVSVCVADAAALPYRASSFDRTYCHLALPFMENAPTALAEMARVTRTGGVITASVWRRGTFEPATLFWTEVRHEVIGTRVEAVAAVNATGLMYLWQSAGLENVETRQFELNLTYRNFDHYWGSVEGSRGPQGRLVAALDVGARRRLRERMRFRLSMLPGHPTISMSAQLATIRGIVPD